MGDSLKAKKPVEGFYDIISFVAVASNGCHIYYSIILLSAHSTPVYFLVQYYRSSLQRPCHPFGAHALW
jgi:hypothetical protein